MTEIRGRGHFAVPIHYPARCLTRVACLNRLAAQTAYLSGLLLPE
jgi:hypothetical protein